MALNLRLWLPLIFFIFIIYIIFLADTADYNFAFRLVGHIPYGDKIAHALLYGVTALLLNYGLDFRRLSHVYLGRFSPYLSSVIVLTFATIEEITRYWIPSRTFDLGDLLADFVGVVLISLIFSKE